MIAGGIDTATAFSWWCAARQSGGRCTARGAVYRLVRLAATRVMPRRPPLCLLLAGCSTRTGVAAVLGWLLMAPMTRKTPRMVRGKPSLEAKAGKRDKKLPAAPSKDRTSAQGKGLQQGALAMEKLQGNFAQVPAMFKQTVRTKQTPPQKELRNEGAEPSEGNSDLEASTGMVARGTDSLDGTGRTLVNGGSDVDPLWDVNRTDPWLLMEENADLGETIIGAGTSSSTQNETLQGTTDAEKIPQYPNLKH
ncbi:hypothetical protein NDU88_004154 [Pleurodeles waltl]|uniref:Uncharacterized protein n=1 Tax=Pleurodeles waltl TaxID=8319 RepID=A0AAV7MFS7_PLEWA|nr:hypothetical protein NDU88_004154 [Pleurodeles waltl]